MSLVGQRLGEYEIVEEIGRGGMADVYRAYQPSLKRHVAIKALPHQYARDKVFVKRFLQEARTAARLEHPNIVPIHEDGEQDGLYYIVMRYVEGDTLKEIIEREGALPLPRVHRIVEHLAGALDYAHSQGVVHRDIKPSNIFVGGEDFVTLADFGIAVAVEATRLTRTGTLVGTPEYMSPEQAKGEEMDWRTDIYSLGIVTYEMLTGRVPFQASTPYAVLHSQIYEAPAPLAALKPNLPASLNRIIQGALSKDPDDRYQTARGLARALAEIEQQAPMIVQEPILPREELPSPRVAVEKAVAPQARVPASPRERLRKSLALVSSLIFVLLAVAASCGNGLWHTAFTVDFYNRQLQRQNVYDSAVSVVTRQAILYGESYSREVAQILELFGEEELTDAVHEILPADWFQTQAEHVVTESIAWIGSEEPTPKIAIPIEDVWVRANWVIGDLAEGKLSELPACRSSDATSVRLCRPRDTDVDSFVTAGRAQILTYVKDFLGSLPEQWRLEDAVSEDPEGLGQLMKEIREGRSVVHSINLWLQILTAVCVAFLISVFFLGGTSPRSLLGWLGGTWVAAGVLALLLTVAGPEVAHQRVSALLSEETLSLLPVEFADMALNVINDFIDTTSSRIRIQSLLAGGVGALCLTVSFLAKSNPSLRHLLRRPARPKIPIEQPAQSERLAVAISHGSIAAVPVIFPLIIWLTHRTRSDFVQSQAKQALLYQLLFVVALLFFPFRLLLWGAASSYGLFSAVKCMRNPNFEYFVIGGLVR